jgi:hypothetical protein
MKLITIRRLTVAVFVAVIAIAIPAAPQAFAQANWQPAVASGEFCKAAPEGFVCGKETCLTACMTPEEWEACPTKSWYADSYDHKFTAPAGATPRNHIRFYERCGTVCRPMGSPRMAYWFEPRKMPDGSNHPGRWIPFAFSAPRGLAKPVR